MNTVAIQGIGGAFHEEAARLWFEQTITILPKMHFNQLVETVEKGECSYGIIAIENTISGTIHRNLSLLKEHQVHVCGEVNLRIQQNLGVIPGVRMEELREVRSHYMAINQCRQYFKQYPNISLVNDKDTALSIKEVADQQLTDVGAIGSMLAMKLYGLEVLAESIETNKLNYTRFFIIQPERKHNFNSAFNKATMTLILPHERGSLNRVLNLFTAYQINLTKLESIPIIGQPYHYEFVMDMEFESMEYFKLVVQILGQITEEFHLLGIYARAEKR